jgi:ferredoxin-thioredoxin reductase catalytic subunit|nr:MAG TPA: ferredoxin-thioredoxin reductase [Caudoviricetes sp.]
MKITLNPDKEIVAIARQQLKETGGYCPCVLEPFRNESAKCQCAEFRRQVAQGIEGECHCGLFIATKD